MPKIAGIRCTITVPSVLALSCIFLAACTSQEVLRSYQYKTAYSDDIHITSKSGREYELKAPWSSDPIGNISGKGNVLVDDEWKPFEGEIPFTDIEKVTTTTYDSSNPVLIYGIVLGVLAVASVIYFLTCPIEITLADLFE